MRELSLFTGAGLGLLGHQVFGSKLVHYCEIDDYRALVVEQRIRDGWIQAHYTRPSRTKDIRNLSGDSWPVDIVTGGFPCQAFSSAARGRNVAEDLWPEMFRIIKEGKIPNVFAENVQRKPIERAARDLVSIGYRASITRLSSACVGAPHRRPRWWLLAHANPKAQRLCAEHAQMACLPSAPGQLWPEPGSEVLGNDDGCPRRVDRLRAIGDGQHPLVAALAFKTLALGQ